MVVARREQKRASEEGENENESNLKPKRSELRKQVGEDGAEATHASGEAQGPGKRKYYSSMNHMI